MRGSKKILAFVERAGAKHLSFPGWFVTFAGSHCREKMKELRNIAMTA
jgi:hypothetical protein